MGISPDYDMPIAILVAEDEGDFRKKLGRLAMTTAQAAGHLGVHAKTFEGMVEEGKVAPWPEMFGNYRLYLADDIEKLKQDRARSKMRTF